MKKYSIWKTNGKNDMFCCQIEAKGEISALKKYAKKHIEQRRKMDR